jgi:hypothetical protein
MISLDDLKDFDTWKKWKHGEVKLKTCINEDDIREAAHEWVFETNGRKWSNNDNSAGDNYGSFMAGAQLVNQQTYSQDQVEKLLEIQRDNCYVAIYDKTLDTEISVFASKAPEPWNWKKNK